MIQGHIVAVLLASTMVNSAAIRIQAETQNGPTGDQAHLNALADPLKTLAHRVALQQTKQHLSATSSGAQVMAGLAQSKTPSVTRALDNPLVDESNLPPFSFTCPMHPEIHETHNGPCPICNMNLVETRRAEAWTCPVHSIILDAKGGNCPIGGRQLIPVRLALTWTCPDHPHVSSLEPGMCPIDGGQQMVQQLGSLPHEDHTPKHGGTFFMAPDNWHHLEGTYPASDRFVLHLYDNYSQPMVVGSAKGRAVLRETYDVDTDEMFELAAQPLVASPDGTFLEANIGSDNLPREISVKIRFDPTGPEERFVFTFTETTRTPSPNPTATAPGAFPAGAAATIGTLMVNIPDRPGEIAAEVSARDAHVQNLLRDGAFTEIWIPALEAKDLALALTPHLRHLPAERQLSVRLAVKELVRAAWLLDWYGDLGNRQRVESAYAGFGQAAAAIATAYSER